PNFLFRADNSQNFLVIVYGDAAIRLTPRGEGEVANGVHMSPRLSPRPIIGGSHSAPSGLSISTPARTTTSPVSSPRRAMPPLLGSNSSYAVAFSYPDPSAGGVIPSETPPTTPGRQLARPYSPGTHCRL